MFNFGQWLVHQIHLNIIHVYDFLAIYRQWPAIYLLVAKHLSMVYFLFYSIKVPVFFDLAVCEMVRGVWDFSQQHTKWL